MINKSDSTKPNAEIDLASPEFQKRAATAPVSEREKLEQAAIRRVSGHELLRKNRTVGVSFRITPEERDLLQRLRTQHKMSFTDLFIDMMKFYDEHKGKTR